MNKILMKVERPGRYAGGEINSVVKDPALVKLRVGMCYPDLYEVGSSNQGVDLLYQIVNEQSDFWCERVYCPAPDMENALRSSKTPLFTIESRTPISELDILGLSLATELTYVNVLTILDLSNLPLLSQERNDSHPLIFAGGYGAFNPEPLADFIDFFLIGDGEELAPKLLDLVSKHKGNHDQILEILDSWDSIYVPKYYQPVFDQEGRQIELKYTGVKPNGIVSKAFYPHFADGLTRHTKAIVPLIETVHDRAVVQIMRGCPHRCKFCQPAWVGGIRQERSKEQVLNMAKEMIDNCGYEECSLLSLSSSDHSQIKAMLNEYPAIFNKMGVNLTLPSLRVDAFDIDIASHSQMLRKSTITLAPEAGSQRLRDLINKNISEEDILKIVPVAFTVNITKIKFYFMIGLPTETEDDLMAIADLAQKLIDQARRIDHNKFRITINISPFVPKPHTPFQRVSQLTINEVKERINILKKIVKKYMGELRWHEPEMSYVEGILCRGDRRIGKVILSAWRKGARLDGWQEYLNIEAWHSALTDCGFTEDYFLRERGAEEMLPWEMIKINP